MGSESERTTTRGSAARVLAAREKKVCPDGVVQEYAIQQQQGDEESWVSGEGGSSSSSSTTMIKTKDGDMEWSATGRIGVSLAQLSAVKDVVFSFKRAESRLVEM